MENAVEWTEVRSNYFSGPAYTLEKLKVTQTFTWRITADCQILTIESPLCHIPDGAIIEVAERFLHPLARQVAPMEVFIDDIS